MSYYCLKVAGLERHLPFVDINDELAFASFVVISDTELVAAVGKLLAEKIGECDAIVTAEAKGIALSYEISRQLGHKCFVVARKSEKSYMKDTIETSVKSITTVSQQHLYLDGSDIEKIRGHKVCLIDDVVSTGESLAALENLVTKAGAIVTAKACILAEGAAADRDDIIYLEKLPLFRRHPDGTYEVIE